MIDEIIKEQQLKFNLSKERIKDVVMSEYIYLNSLIENGDLESVRIPGLGLFIVKPYRKIKLDEELKQDNGEDIIKGDISRMERSNISNQGE